MADETRVATLMEILTKIRTTRLRGTLGLEYSGGGETDAALNHLKLLRVHPDYTNGYFMAAQTLMRRAKDEARHAAARHRVCAPQPQPARPGEMEGMLDELERGY